MSWNVQFSHKAGKQALLLSKRPFLALQTLVEDLRTFGAYPGKHWPNYGPSSGKKNEDKRHCHLVKGKPTYVCCWEVLNKKNKLIEVYYVGTHEKAPY